MTNGKITPKLYLAMACAMSLSLLMGCPQKSKDSPSTDLSEEITFKMIYDEAAKGGGADLVSFDEMYTKKIKTKADGDELLKIKDDGENIICKIVQLPAVKQPRKILVDLVSDKLSDAALAINEDCKNAKKSLDHMIDPARKVAGDTATDADDMINVLVDKGDKDTVARASDKAKMDKVLGAIKNKGNQALLTRVFKQAPAGLKAEIIAWSTANQADPKVAPALRDAALVTDNLLVHEVQKGAAADTALLKLLYDSVIDSPAKAADLATKPTSLPNKFSNFLSMAPADANTAALWSDYLTKIAANSNAAAVVLQINLVGAGTTPIAAMLNTPRAAAAHDNLDMKKAIIALMVQKGNQATVRTADDQAKINLLFDAVLEKQPAALNNAVVQVDIADVNRKNHLLAWSLANRNAAAVPAALAALGVFTDQDVIDAARNVLLGDPAALPNLKALYFARIKGSAAGVRAVALAALDNLGANFPHILAQIIPDAELTEIWQDYLGQIHAAAELVLAGSGDNAVSNVARLPDPTAPGNANHLPLNRVLAHRVLAAADAQDQIVYELVKFDVTALTAVVEPDNLFNLLYSMQSKGTKANFLDAFTLALNTPALLKTSISWAGENDNALILHEPAPQPTVYEALAELAAAGTITPLILVDETYDAADDVKAATAARGGAGEVDANNKMLASIKSVALLYALVVTDHASAAALAAQAPTLAPAGYNFSFCLAYLPAGGLTLQIWTDYLAKLSSLGGNEAIDQMNLAVAGNTPFEVITLDNRSAYFGDYEDDNILNEIIVQMVRQDDGTVLRRIADDDEAYIVLDAIYRASDRSVDFNKVVQHLADAHIGMFSKFVISYFDTSLDDGTTIKSLFQAEYAHPRRAGAGQQNMNNALIKQAYYFTGEALLREAQEHMTRLRHANGNTLAEAIELADAGNTANRLDAIVADLEARNIPPVDAVRAFVLNGNDLAVVDAIVPMVVKAGVDMVKEVIAEDYLDAAALQANNFDPFGFGNATLLFSVLAKVKDDLGANLLTHDLIDNGATQNGLASTLKDKLVAGGANWQAYLDTPNNLGFNGIEAHLVRPDAGGSQATAQAWLNY